MPVAGHPRPGLRPGPGLYPGAEEVVAPRRYIYQPGDDDAHRPGEDLYLGRGPGDPPLTTVAAFALTGFGRLGFGQQTSAQRSFALVGVGSLNFAGQATGVVSDEPADEIRLATRFAQVRLASTVQAVRLTTTHAYVDRPGHAPSFPL